MQAGDVIAGRYRLECSLGRGGMGEVWAATNTLTEQRRALKFVHDDDHAARKRMLREARAASAVRHPNVVAVHDVIEGLDGAPVLVMDLLEGETLADRLERVGRLPPAEAVAVTRAILEALDAAHALGIIHRDLKPANVFLAPEPKLLDFGVAKLTAESGPARATNLLTASGAMIGTPCYMAPEQAFGDGVVDARADLWSVGAVLYELLAGVRPADGATLGQVLRVLATGAIVPVEARVAGLPPALSAFVGDLLASERTARPASARAALAKLDAILLSGVDATRLARPDSTAGTVAVATRRPMPKRLPMVLAGAAVVGLALFGGLRLRVKLPEAGVDTTTVAPLVATAVPTVGASVAPPLEASPFAVASVPAPSRPSSHRPKAKASAAPSAALPVGGSKLLTQPTF